MILNIFLCLDFADYVRTLFVPRYCRASGYSACN